MPKVLCYLPTLGCLIVSTGLSAACVDATSRAPRPSSAEPVGDAGSSPQAPPAGDGGQTSPDAGANGPSPSDAGSTHPPEPPSDVVRSATGFSGRLMGRTFIVALLREVFMPPGDGRELDRALRDVELAPSNFGRPCNIYSSHSGKDCEDAPISGTSAPMMGASTTVRQLNKMVVCENILHRVEHVHAAASRVGGLQNGALVAPRLEHTRAVLGLFFRAEPVATEVLNATHRFVERLGREGAELDDQWRGLLQIVCEMPGWEAV